MLGTIFAIFIVTLMLAGLIMITFYSTSMIRGLFKED